MRGTIFFFPFLYHDICPHLNEFANELQVENLENFVNFSLWCAFKKKKRKKKLNVDVYFG